ncbi:MAG: hypothetical protein V7K41_22505 [Nostoc sp.]
MDEVDEVFKHPIIAADFFGLQAQMKRLDSAVWG